jgi:hypothetical protein
LSIAEFGVVAIVSTTADIVPTDKSEILPPQQTQAHQNRTRRYRDQSRAVQMQKVGHSDHAEKELEMVEGGMDDAPE